MSFISISASFSLVLYPGRDEALLPQQGRLKADRDQHCHTCKTGHFRFASRSIWCLNFLTDQANSELAEKAVPKPVVYRVTPETLQNVKDVRINTKLLSLSLSRLIRI